MAVKLEQLYFNSHGDRIKKDNPLAQRGNLLLTIGSMDGEDQSYEFNEAQLNLLQTAVFYWKYERDRGKQVECVLAKDDGWTSVKNTS